MIRPLRGVLPVDKPVGPTSHDIVARARRALGIQRIGHTGTLDPFASGLLLLCVGPATRLSEYLTHMDKRYRAEARLGVSTDTHDHLGTVVREDEGWRTLDEDVLEAALDGFRGALEQRPPRFSAKKVGGEAAHRKARRGEDVVLEPVAVEVFQLEVTELEPPKIAFEIHCSSGTYIRALARDLGGVVGVGAHLTSLRRTAVGGFTVAGALSVDALTEADAVARALISPARALGHLPTVEVGVDEARRLCQGQGIDLGVRELPSDEPVAVLQGSELVAVAARRGGELRPRKVFTT